MGPAALAAALLVPLLFGPLHGPIKRATRARLAAFIGSPAHLRFVAAAQRRQHPVLDAAVAVSAATVTVEFYLTLLPLLVWTGHPQLVARLVALLGLAGYACFAVKDLLEAPRPGDVAAKAGLELRVHNNCGDVEDGIPSAHVSGSVLLLFYGLESAAAAGWLSSSASSAGGPDPALLLALQLAAAAWVAWVAWGRLYLGLHSPADLAAGGLLGWLLLALWRELDAGYTAWLESGGGASGSLPQQLQVLAAAALLMRCYPQATRRRTSCYEHATCWCGGWTGVTLGYLHVRDARLAGAAVQQQLVPRRLQLPLAAAKIAIGLLVMVVTKVAVKQACLWLLPRVFDGCVPTWVRCLWQPPVAGVAPGSAGAGAAADCAPAAKQQQQGAKAGSRSGGGSSSRRSCDGRPQHDQDGAGGASRCSSSDGAQNSSSGSSGSRWVLRHGPTGTANDVEATSRFLSWAVMCFVILTYDAWWQPLVRQLAYSTSLA